MSLIHMMFFYLKAEFMKYSHAANTKNNLLFQAVCNISSVEVMGNFPVFRHIPFDIRIKKEDRNTSPCEAFNIKLPGLYKNLTAFNLNRNLCWKQCHMLRRIPGIWMLCLSAAVIQFLNKISLFCQESHSDHGKLEVCTSPDRISGQHTESAAVCRYVVLYANFH